MGKLPKAFPSVIYLRIEEEDGEDAYIIAGETPEELATETGVDHKLARYTLVQTGVLYNRPKYVERAKE